MENKETHNEYKVDGIKVMLPKGRYMGSRKREFFERIISDLNVIGKPVFSIWENDDRETGKPYNIVIYFRGNR